MDETVKLTCATSSGRDGEEYVADDSGGDDDGGEDTTTTNAVRLFKKPSGGGTADDGANGEGRFMDGHAQRAIGASGDAVEHAVCVGMCAEDTGYGDEHDNGDRIRRETEKKHVDGQQQMPDN